MRSKNVLYFFIFTGIVLFSAFTLLFFRQATQSKALPVLGQVADFHLYDTESREFGLTQLKGKVWVADFIFTTCSGICPVMTKNMAALHRSFLLVDGVEMVSITVNPENDSPGVLAAYAKRYHADLKKWHFLTGARAEIQKLAVHSFKIGSVKEPVFHSDRFVLVDRQGRIRGYYEGTEDKRIGGLFKDIVTVTKEEEK